MKKYILLLFILGISSSLSLAQNLSREDKIKAVEMLSDFFGKPLPSKTPVPDVISEKGLPNNLNTGDFDKKLTLEEAIQIIKTRTHQYIKRQYTWFNKQSVSWIDRTEPAWRTTVERACSQYLAV